MKHAIQPNSATPVGSSPSVKSGTEQFIQPFVNEASASASRPESETRSSPSEETRSNPSLEINVETRSIPPKVTRSNTSLETKVDTVNGNLQSSFPVYSQDVNSTQSPSE